MREEQGGVGAAWENQGGGTAEASRVLVDSLLFTCAHSCANTVYESSSGSSVSVKTAASITTSAQHQA